MSAHTIFFAILGGTLPALFWLWFWLREDTIHPEPRGLIVLVFVAGMFAAPLAVFPQSIALQYFGSGTVVTLAIWALIEELLKYGAAALMAFGKKNLPSPIDAMMYLITAALGFSATENILFLLNPIRQGDILSSIITENIRFVGASLLHVMASALIGAFIALAYYKSRMRKVLYLISGFILAIALHTVFNFFIIQGEGMRIFSVFSALWIAVILLLLIFEKVKRIRPQ